MILKLFLWLFFALGIMFLGATVIVKVSFEKKRKNCTQMVEAIIIDIQEMVRRETGDITSKYVSYFPIYEYEYMGKIYQSGTNVGNLKNAFEIGEKVHIYIDPRNPEIIYEDSKVPKLVGNIFGIIGVIFVITSVLLKVLVFK